MTTEETGYGCHEMRKLPWQRACCADAVLAGWFVAVAAVRFVVATGGASCTTICVGSLTGICGLLR